MSDLPPSTLTAVPGVVGVSSVAPATPAISTVTVSKGHPVSALVGWLSSTTFFHLAGLAAVSVLTGVGIIPSEVGVPVITGLVGLGINTTTGTSPSASGK